MCNAVQAALACGLNAGDLKELIDELAADKAMQSGSLGQPWHKVPTMTPGPSEVADRSRYDILSPQPVPREQPAPSGAQTGQPVPSRAAASDRIAPQASGGAMSKRQLRELAERRGLDYDLLLADAAAQGLALED